MDQVKSGVADFIELAKTYSEIPFTEAFFKHGELSQQKEKVVFSAMKDEIVGPIKDSDGIHLIKILDQRPGTTEYVKASHILLKMAPGQDSVKIIQKARDLLRKARSGADFAQLARENSQDYGSAMQGGELGWSSREQWVKPFADAAFKTRIGEIVGPVRTQFGWHIIKVSGRDKREVKIVDLALKVRASTQTIDEAFQRAQDFSYLAKEEGYEKAAENSKYTIQETPEFQKTGTIYGIGYNEAVTNFAFANKIGTISDPIHIQIGVAVFKVSGIKEEGLRSLDEVKNIVQSMALRDKKMMKLRGQVDEFYKTLTPSSDLITTTQSIPNLIAQKTGPFTPVTFPAGVGRDLKFIGAALSLKSGELSKPVDGNRGFYIIKLLSRTEIDTVKYDVQRASLREQLLQEKRNRAISDWQTALREKAEIVDNRDKFYQ